MEQLRVINFKIKIYHSPLLGALPRFLASPLPPINVHIPERFSPPPYITTNAASLPPRRTPEGDYPSRDTNGNCLPQFLHSPWLPWHRRPSSLPMHSRSHHVTRAHLRGPALPHAPADVRLRNREPYPHPHFTRASYRLATRRELRSHSHPIHHRRPRRPASPRYHPAAPKPARSAPRRVARHRELHRHPPHPSKPAPPPITHPTHLRMARDLGLPLHDPALAAHPPTRRPVPPVRNCRHKRGTCRSPASAARAYVHVPHGAIRPARRTARRWLALAHSAECKGARHTPLRHHYAVLAQLCRARNTADGADGALPGCAATVLRDRCEAGAGAEAVRRTWGSGVREAVCGEMAPDRGS